MYWNYCYKDYVDGVNRDIAEEERLYGWSDKRKPMCSKKTKRKPNSYDYDYELSEGEKTLLGLFPFFLRKNYRFYYGTKIK